MLLRIVPENRNGSCGTYAEAPAIGAQVEVGDRRAVDQDAPRRDVVEACDELHDRRLPCSRLTHERDGLAGGHRQIDAVHDLDTRRRVAEVHVVECDRARDATGLDRVFGIGRGHLGVHELVDLRHRREGRLPLVEHLRQLLDRGEELVEEQDEREHRSRSSITPCCTSVPPYPNTMASAHVERNMINGK